MSTAVARYEVPTVAIRRFSVDEYHRLIQSGVFGVDERFELLDGWIVAKMSRDPIHDAAVQIVDELLRRHLPAGWSVRVQSAITTADSEPEPDIAIVRGAARDYLQKHPGPRDTAIVIEVANATLEQDRLLKGRIYAKARMPEYWLVNLVDRQIEVYSDPSSGPAGYERRSIFTAGQFIPFRVEAALIAELPIDELLP